MRLVLSSLSLLGVEQGTRLKLVLDCLLLGLRLGGRVVRVLPLTETDAQVRYSNGLTVLAMSSASSSATRDDLRGREEDGGLIRATSLATAELLQYRIVN